MKVSEFIRQNTPATVELSLKQIESAARAAELIVNPDETHPDLYGLAVLTKWGPETEERTVGRRAFGQPITQEFPVWCGWIFSGDFTPRIAWVSKIGDQTVTYEPLLLGFKTQRGVGNPEGLVTALGFGPITVQAPEPIVKMPAPSWVEVWSEDWTAGITVSYAFLSEAKKLCDEFVKQLDELFK